MKKLINAVKRKTKAVVTFGVACAISAFSAVSAFAAGSGNADLDTATTSLTDGVTSMKTNALVIIAATIAVIVVVFGIGWLIGIVKRNMSKA